MRVKLRISFLPVLLALMIVSFAALHFPAFQVESAQQKKAIFINGGGGASQGVYSGWVSWDESTEAGLTLDMDGNGVEDTSVFFAENITDGGSEIGRGVASGGDLQFTQQGSINGASGSPPRRALVDGYAQHFRTTSGYLTTLFNNQPAFSLILRFGESTQNIRQIISWRRATGPAYGWDIYGDAGSGVMQIQCSLDGSGAPFTLNGATSGAMPTSGPLYVACWSDGVYWRAGFTSVKPTKWSDFPASQRISVTSSAQWSCPFDAAALYIGGGDAGTMNTDFYYMVASQKCLIDNAS